MYANLNDVERIKDTIETISGSGVNYEYEYEIRPSRKYGMLLEAYNLYDNMNDAGMYTVTTPFSVVVPIDNPEDFKVVLHGGCHNRDGLRDYLEELYAPAIERVLVK